MINPNKANLKHILKDELPEKIFCDTNFFVSSILRYEIQKHNVCQEFIKKIIEKRVLVCFNTVVYYEVYIAFLNNVLERAKRSKKLHITQPEVLEPYLKVVASDYERFITLLKGLWLMEFKVSDINIFNCIAKAQVEHRLHIADAFHLGTMLFTGENNLVSFDKHDFGNIPNINLWCEYD